MQVLPIASGKGGVGKSLVATNLSLALAQAGKKVVLADLDLGGSNIHLMLGQVGINQGIGTFLVDQNIKFEDIILKTEYSNLWFIPGDTEIPGIANLKSSQKQKLIRRLNSIEADYLILDLGAGSNYNTVDFFLISGRGIIVTDPTPTANLNAYLFLKNVIFRIMNSAFKKKTKAYEYIEKLNKSGSPFQKVYVPRLIKYIRENDPESYQTFRERMENFRPKLVFNMIEDPKDSHKAGKLRRSCKEYLDIEMEHLGVVYRDALQDVALQSRLPILIYKPHSVLSQAIYRIADKLMKEYIESPGPMDFEEIEESYQEAEMEAEVDFDTKMKYMEDLLHCGALTSGDLIETIKTQQYEISQLKKENNFIKAKLVKAMKEGFVE